MDNCIFCKIIAGEIPSMRIYEDDQCIATLDIGPASKGHTLVIPKSHYTDVTDGVPEELLGKLMKTASKIGVRQIEKLGAAGFNIVQNNGEAAGQTVRHLHIHVIPRYEGGPGMVGWEPTKPETAELQEVCELLRD